MTSPEAFYICLLIGQYAAGHSSCQCHYNVGWIKTCDNGCYCSNLDDICQRNMLYYTSATVNVLLKLDIMATAAMKAWRQKQWKLDVSNYEMLVSASAATYIWKLGVSSYEIFVSSVKKAWCQQPWKLGVSSFDSLVSAAMKSWCQQLW